IRQQCKRCNQQTEQRAIEIYIGIFMRIRNIQGLFVDEVKIHMREHKIIVVDMMAPPCTEQGYRSHGYPEGEHIPAAKHRIQPFHHLMTVRDFHNLRLNGRISSKAREHQPGGETNRWSYSIYACSCSCPIWFNISFSGDSEYRKSIRQCK